MNNPNIPGFTADASLRRTRGCYGLTAAGDTAHTGQAVIPALAPPAPFWRGVRCAIACKVCEIAGGVGPSCWTCRNCILTGDAPGPLPGGTTMT